MEPQAVGIRLDPVKVGPTKLVGKTPIVVFAEQGLAGAGLNESPTMADGNVLVADADADDGQFLDAGLPDFRHGASQKFQIGKLIFVVDRSGSMGCEIEPGSQTNKLTHIKQEIEELECRVQSLGENPLSDTEMILIEFDSASSKVDLSPDKKGITAVQEGIMSIEPGGGTRFETALELVDNELSKPDSLQNINSRNIVVLMTDGHDAYASKINSEMLAAKIRSRGAGTASFVVGVGTGYDVAYLVKLSQKFGCCGRTHTPMENGGGLGLLMEFIANIQSSEYYMKVKAPLSAAEGMYGLTPAIKPADNGIFYIGYQQEGVGICFVDDPDPNLKLEVGSSVSDPNPTNIEIPLVDFDAAGAYFEKLEYIRKELKLEIVNTALPPLLIQLAQLDHDAEVLEKLKEAYPQHSAAIDASLEQIHNPNDEAAIMQSFQSQSNIGTVTAGMTMTFDDDYELPPASPQVPDAADVDAEAEIEPPADQVNPQGETAGQVAGMTLGFHQSIEDIKIEGVDASDGEDPDNKEDEAAPSEDASNEVTGIYNLYAPQSDQLLHSGNLGALSDPAPDEIPPMKTPNPDAYNGLVPVNHARLVFDGLPELQEYDLFSVARGSRITIGRETDCTPQLSNPMISRRHLVIYREKNEDKFLLQDLGSSNGTYINGKNIGQEIYELKDRDLLKIGPIRATFRAAKRKS